MPDTSVTYPLPNSVEQFADRFFDAFNQRDLDTFLSMMHEGAAYYDGYWMEYCVGKDLKDYFEQSFLSENYWYQRVGLCVRRKDTVAVRYSAFERIGETIGKHLFDGVEYLTLKDNKVVSFSDFYTESDDESLMEMSRIVSRRHAQVRYSTDGLSSYVRARHRKSLTELLDYKKQFLDPKLTLEQLAEQLSCPIEHLTQVIAEEFDTDSDKLLMQRRAEHAFDLMLLKDERPGALNRIAEQSGFRSVGDLLNAFQQVYGRDAQEFMPP